MKLNLLKEKADLKLKRLGKDKLIYVTYKIALGPERKNVGGKLIPNCTGNSPRTAGCDLKSKLSPGLAPVRL